MKINKRLTKINYRKGSNKQNKYIVIHYVGATGGAEANCKYFESVYRGASAHYFVGHAGEVWQCVEDKDISWHCGAAKYKHKECRNTNSIGIEMCCRKGDGWYFEAATVASTIDLVKELMAKYNIPVGNVIRHYDVTGKTCPEPYVRNVDDWNLFKSQLTTTKLEKVKTNEVIAQEVIAQKWGNGADRKKRLTAAGYDYDAIQAIVNELLGAKTVNKSVETVAKEVIAQKWGNGIARRKALTAAGYNYSEVQAMVNKLMKKG
jgi:N-acetyl-anhydromuramyl-L-alanine amidase AmpD